MEISPQFVKNMLKSVFKTKILNPGEISSPVVEAIKDPEVAKRISKPIVMALVDVMEKMDKYEKRLVENEGKELVVKNIEDARVDISEALNLLKEIRDKEEKEIVFPEYPTYPEQKEIDLSPVTKAIEKVAKLIPKLTKEEQLDYTKTLSEILEEIKKDRSGEWQPILECLERIEEKESPIFEIPSELIKDGRILVNVDKVGGGGPSTVHLRNESGVAINPATSEKQDDIITALGAIGGDGLTDAQLRATPVPVSTTSLPLPTGAATEYTVDVISGRISDVDAKLGTIQTDLASLLLEVQTVKEEVTTYDLISVTLEGASDGVILTPTSGYKLRIYDIKTSLSADVTSIKFSGSAATGDIEKYLNPKSGGLYGASRGKNYTELAVDETLDITIVGTASYAVNVKFIEVT